MKMSKDFVRLSTRRARRWSRKKPDPLEPAAAEPTPPKPSPRPKPPMPPAHLWWGNYGFNPADWPPPQPKPEDEDEANGPGESVGDIPKTAETPSTEVADTVKPVADVLPVADAPPIGAKPPGGKPPHPLTVPAMGDDAPIKAVVRAGDPPHPLEASNQIASAVRLGDPPHPLADKAEFGGTLREPVSDLDRLPVAEATPAAGHPPGEEKTKKKRKSREKKARQNKEKKARRDRIPGPRGWHKGGAGHAGVVVDPPWWRATTQQACGLWPFSNGVGTPMIGAPLGHSLLPPHQTVCADPVSWFAIAGLIPNPSMIITGKPGMGKSSTVRHMATCLAGFGVTPLVFGDLKPDYIGLIKALGGNVVRLGRGRGCLNVLDPGAAFQVAAQLKGEAKERLLADVRGRRLTLLEGLLALNRQAPVTDHEEAILSASLNVIDDRFPPGETTLHQLIEVIIEGPESIRRITMDRGDSNRYESTVEGLVKSLTALAVGGLGDVFAHKTTTPIDLSAPLCIDISGIPESDEKLQAAVLMACWTEGFGSITAMQALADEGLAPQRNFVVILDELWRVMRAGSGMIDRIDALTRLDRATGVGTIMVTHTLKDLAVAGGHAQGFAERMGMFGMCGVPASEIEEIKTLMKLSNAEADLLTSWWTPDSWDPKTGKRADPPGLGKILLKVGGRAGIPVQVKLTPTELEVNDTNQKWAGT